MSKKKRNPHDKRRITRRTLREWGFGYLFIAPWIVGVSIFFLYAMVRSLEFSFSKVELSNGVILHPLENGLFENFGTNMEIMVIPAFILGSVMAGSVMRMTRSSMLEVLRQDYIKAVRAKGAPERVTIFRHAFRNSSIPIITLIGMQIGSLMGGTVVIEQIFSIPGLGQYTLTGINQRDYPVVQGCVLFIAVLYVVINLLVDILYTYIDPRISYN